MLSQLKTIPYWRLSGFYFFNCAVLGAILPYWGLYLKELSFTASQIGTVGAVLMATNIVAPNMWGWLSDRSGKRMAIIRWGNFAAFAAFLWVFVANGYFAVVVIMAACSFCWQGLNSQFEVVTLSHLREQSSLYGYVRMWGSIGFVVAVSGLGAVFDIISVRYAPVFVALFLLMTWASTLAVPSPSAVARSYATGGVREILRKPAVWGLFLAVLMLHIGHGAYYTFYSVYLDDLGYHRTFIGLLWSLAVVSEVCMFMAMHWLSEVFSLRALLLLSVALAIVRWLMIGYLSDSLWLLAFAQLLHAFTFTSVHVIVIELIRRHFGEHHHGQGQALYCSLCVGGGGALGAWFSGQLWEWSAAGTFGLAALVSGLGLLIAWRWVRVPPRPVVHA